MVSLNLAVNTKRGENTMNLPNVTTEDIIKAHIAKGKTIAYILKNVVKKNPGTVIDERDITFYANKMVKSGELSTEDAENKYGRKKKVEEKPNIEKKEDKKISKPKSKKSTKPRKKRSKT